MADINVLITVDAETVISKYGNNSNPDSPQPISSDLIFMVTDQANALDGQGGANLTINAQTLDDIRWYATSLSLEAAYSVLLYKFESSGAHLISTPEPRLVQVKTPLPNEDDPLHPTTQTIENYFWQSTVENPGDVVYHFNFMVVGRDGTVLGYYYWDPYIHITA